MKTYRKRIADDILRRKLEGKGAVLIEGPKWCGKTTTAEQLAASVLYVDDPEMKEENILMSETHPKRLLEGATPRLIDEWQLVPKLWDAIRFEVDHRDGIGHFILTGSAVPADTKDITHSGIGRLSVIGLEVSCIEITSFFFGFATLIYSLISVIISSTSARCNHLLQNSI